ncbi:amino acid adenylation domain-containing protein, partial [Pseudoalteromonas sp. SMS1]|uniref:amino acid adenylation domain-containing protein n=1 Tax=Pseudoalteromonas sp. SMS1 TaxID=2908894 RepID=UPI001F2FF24F
MQCKDKHPLALAQQDIYLHQIQNGNNPMYNIGGLLKLTNIEPDKLKKAHECLIENHESFGLRIEEGSTGPRQYISAKRTKALNELDFSSHSKGPETALNWVNSEFQTSFSLYDCELYKAYLIRISENNYWYCFIAHHLMIDGWGFAKLIESLGEYYCGREPQGNTHWKKVIANDFSYLEGSQYLKDKAYWEQQITALPEPLLTPYYRSYFADPKCIPSGRKSMTIPSDKYTALNALAKHCGVGLAQVFLGLLATCLCRSYEKAQLLVGMPVHNRKRYDDKQHIGLFTSVSPMLVDIDKDARFIDLLKQLNDRQRRNFRHQKYPFGELVRRLGGVGHSGAALEVEYNYLKLKSNFEIGNGSASVHYLSHHHNPIPLSLTVWEFGDSQPTELHMDFNKAFFNDKEASLLLNRFYEMTLQFMADVELKVRDFSIISSSEQALISEMSIGPKVDLSEQLIHDAFVQRATDTPEKTALIFNNKTMSYGELNAVTNQLANYLSETYKNSEVPVIGVSLARSFELVISILATLKAGFTYVPLDPSLPKTRLDHIVNDTQLCCILTQRNLQPCFEGSHADITLLDAPELKQRLAQFSTVPALCRASADGLAYIFYTSGTTGKPKGVAVEHHSVVNRLEWGQKQYQLNSDDIVLQKTPFNFDVSVWEIFWPLRQGATMLLAKPEGHKDPDYICALMNEFEVSVVQFVPSMLHAYIQINPGMMPASLRYVFCSGEALGVEEVQYLAKHSPHLQVFNLYGPTEASIEVSHFACADLGKRHSVPIGKPIQNVSLHVLNTQREVCPIGVAGELFIGGICLAREYLNLAHLTSEHFQLINVSDSTALRLYKTGDLARYSVDGNIEYLGRNDHQVKIRGLRVELTEIEAVLNSSDQVNSSLVLPSAQNSLIAYVLCAHVNSQLSDVELIATLKETLHSKLPSYMVPEHFVFVTAWPMTANGKIDKKALPAPQLQSSTCFEAPTTQT